MEGRPGHGSRGRRSLLQRLSDRRHRRLYAVRDELYWTLAGRLDAGDAAVRDAIPSLTLGAQPRFSPPLWNDLARPLLEPRPSVSEQLAASPEPVAALREAAATVLSRLNLAQLDALGWDAVERLARADSTPVPAPPDREHYYAASDLAYWLSGLADLALVLDAVHRHGDGGRRAALLDLGCASGRVVRHVPALAPGLAAFGVDIGLTGVAWARRWLPPAITVAQGTVLPHLPFADGELDVVYAGSVFTHIGDFEEAWLLELRRVLRPGGIAVLTIHPERIWAEARDPEHVLARIVTGAPHRLDPLGVEPVTAAVFEQPMPAPRVVFTQTTYPVNNVNVVHADAWIADRWSRAFELVERVPGGHDEHQDALVLRRPG